MEYPGGGFCGCEGHFATDTVAATETVAEEAAEEAAATGPDASAASSRHSSNTSSAAPSSSKHEMSGWLSLVRFWNTPSL